MRLEYRFLNLVLVRVRFKCLGLFWVVVINGKLIFVWVILESLILVFFVVFVKCCSVCLFLCRLMFFILLNFAAR